MVQKDDPQVTSNALNLGVQKVVTKRDLTPQTLAAVVREASMAEPSKHLSAPSRKDSSADAAIVARAQRLSGDGVGYKLTRLIGQGAMSRVYLAERLEDEKIKIA